MIELHVACSHHEAAVQLGTFVFRSPPKRRTQRFQIGRRETDEGMRPRTGKETVCILAGMNNVNASSQTAYCCVTVHLCVLTCLQRPGGLLLRHIVSGNSRVCRHCCSACGVYTGACRPQRTAWQRQRMPGGMTVHSSGTDTPCHRNANYYSSMDTVCSHLGDLRHYTGSSGMQAPRRSGRSGSCWPSQTAAGGILQPNMAITVASESPALVPQYGESCHYAPRQPQALHTDLCLPTVCSQHAQVRRAYCLTQHSVCSTLRLVTHRCCQKRAAAPRGAAAGSAPAANRAAS